MNFKNSRFPKKPLELLSVQEMDELSAVDNVDERQEVQPDDIIPILDVSSSLPNRAKRITAGQLVNKIIIDNPIFANRTLSNLSDYEEARNNLGLGSLATEDLISLAITDSDVPNINARLGVFNTMADLENSNVSPVLNGVMVLGFYVAGDGGGARLRRKPGSEPTYPADRTSNDGARWTLSDPLINAKMFGVRGDGVTNDTPAFQLGIEHMQAIGGGTIWIPDGEYFLRRSVIDQEFDNGGLPIWANNPAGGAALVLRPKVSLIGINHLGPKFRIDTVGGVCSAIYPISPDGNSIENLEIDVGWTSGLSGTGHGILQVITLDQPWCRDFSVRKNFVHNCRSYGIGVENGDVVNLTIERNDVLHTGADGIDVKGRGPDAGEQYGMWISKNTIRRWGLRLNSQAGIDWRGVAVVRDNYVFNEYSSPEDDARTGIRGRPETPIGFGASRSKVMANHVQSNIRGAFRGFELHASDMTIIGNDVHGAHWGFRLGSDGAPTVGQILAANQVRDTTTAFGTFAGVEYTTFSDNVAISCDTMYWLRGDVAWINGSLGRHLTTVIDFGGGNNTMVGGRVGNVTGDPIVDGGGSNRVRGVHGIRTRNRVQSSAFLADTIETIPVTIPHLLAVTPTPNQVLLTVRMDGNPHPVSGLGYRALVVNGTDDTNIYAEITVTREIPDGSMIRIVADVNTEQF